MFEKLEVPIIGVVENMSGDFFGEGAGKKLAAEQGAEYLGSVPLDAQVRVGGDNGNPIIVSAPESPAAEALSEIASAVAARVSLLTLANQDSMIPIQVIN